MGKIKHVIIDGADECCAVTKILKGGLMPFVREGGRTIMGRWGTNKTALRKILKGK